MHNELSDNCAVEDIACWLKRSQNATSTRGFPSFSLYF